MNTYNVTLHTYTNITVTAKSREEAEDLALEMAEDIDGCDLSWSVDDVERTGAVDAEGRVLPDWVRCENCEHYVQEQRLCTHCNEPNDKDPDWFCSLFDLKEERL